MAATLEQLIVEAVRVAVREELERVLDQLAPSVLTTEQAAARAGVEPKTIRNWVSEGRLPAARSGRRLAIRREDLDRLRAGGPSSPAAAADEAWRRLRRVG